MNDIETRRRIRNLEATKKILGPGWYADALALLIEQLKQSVNGGGFMASGGGRRGVQEGR